MYEEGVRRIEDIDQKEKISTEILADLSEWFGLPDSTAEYIHESKKMSFFAYYKENQYVGFLVGKETSDKTIEIYVMGVLKKFHRNQIGKKLFRSFVSYAKNSGYEYLQVKTVEEGYYKEYDETRLFYEKMGFRKLECFPTLWDEWNPCLIMIQSIEAAWKEQQKF